MEAFLHSHFCATFICPSPSVLLVPKQGEHSHLPLLLYPTLPKTGRKGKVSLFLWRKRNGPFNNKYSEVQPLLTTIRLEAMKLGARHFIGVLNCQWFMKPRLFACFDPYICLTVPFNAVGQPYLHAKC